MSKDFNFIDIHGHLNLADFDADESNHQPGREEAIKRAYDTGVAMITVGTDMASSIKAVELASTHENMWAAVGIHPDDAVLANAPDHASIAGNIPIDWDRLEGLAQHPKVVAIGECGLDYLHAGPGDIPLQEEVFERQIALANKVGKPLMLHVRNAKAKTKDISGSKIVMNAYQDALAMLKKSAKVRANFHFFAGSVQDLKDIVALNHTVSFTGVITFTDDYDELVKSVPATHIMSETDCPFVTPVPHRGERNEPAYVIEVVKAIAHIRGEDEGRVAKQLVDNARNFFNLN
jgi:TatD DNase family protein